MTKNSQKQSATELSAKDYTYKLPKERIAAYPLSNRDTSRLLVYRNGDILDTEFRNIPAHIPEEAMMVFNNTKVVQARLEFFKETGARIEIFCLHPESPQTDVALGLGSPSPVSWQCLVGNAKKWKDGPLTITHPGQDFFLEAWKGDQHKEGYLIHFRWEPSSLSFAEVLDMVGKTPLPPYITRAAEEKDKSTYQTIFALEEGSVAAPTAGLHFTDDVMQALGKQQVVTEYITLHVGAGTFKPVSSVTIGGHHMHAEQFSIERNFLERLLNHNGPCIPVGTTCMRTLESLFWLGAGLVSGKKPDGDRLFLPQWTPYEWEKARPGKKEALTALLDYMVLEKKETLEGETALIIVPGYPFIMTDALVTNFHQPGSTLLLLVAAFVGDQWQDIYRHALHNAYRFLSYGDACLLFRNNSRRE